MPVERSAFGRDEADRRVRVGHMHVRVDLGARTVALAEPDNFKQFHVVARGDGLDDDVADLLGDGGRRCDTPSHVWVGIDLVRRLAEPQVSAEWADGFEVSILALAGSAR